MTELFFLVSSAKSAAVREPLARACQWNGTSWCCFFTEKGVQQLKSPNLVKLLNTTKRTVVCEYSWHEFMGSKEGPNELGKPDHQQRTDDRFGTRDQPLVAK